MLFVILKFCFSLIHKVYSYNFLKFIEHKSDLFYSLWISSNFKNIDNTAIIGKDCDLKGGEYIEIGKNSIIGRHSVLSCWDKYQGEKFSPKIEIGENCYIGEYCHISSINSIKIGNGVLTGRFITITDNSHGSLTSLESETIPSKRRLNSKGAVVIEDNVWIGDKVTILAGVHVGRGAIVAANTVVTKNVLKYNVVGGVPARVIKIITD